MKTTYRVLPYFLMALIIALAACDATQFALEDTTQQATPPKSFEFVRQITLAQKPGLTTHLLRKTLTTEPDILLVALDKKQYTPTLVVAPEKGISVKTAMADQQLQVIIGSGFVSDLHSLEAVGLLQHRGTVLSPVQRHGYTRILGINDAGLGVVHRKHYQRGLFHSALQVGPGIVEAGKLDISVRDLQRPQYFRSFVALCERSWVVGISLTPMNLRPIGERVQAFFTQAQMVCDEIVNLAGDREAVFALHTAEKPLLYHGDVNTHKVSMIGFTAN